jgi:cytoskeletal protein CcmA (bactofilin family)
MFNKNNKSASEGHRPADTTSNSINIIGAGTVIEGDIKSSGDLRVDGTVYGSIHSKAKVVIGSTGVVEGDVNSQNADVSGCIKGKSTISELLFLKSSAKITGDIVTGKLVVEVGASFTGTCNMGPVIKDIKPIDKPADSVKQERTA